MAVEARGVDYSWARPDPGCLRSKGYSFVLRYVWGTGKLLKKDEADRLKAAGLRIVSNFESWANRCLDGYNAGAEDARTAVANTKAAGGPAAAVIYFSVDFDASASQLSGPVANYFRGAVSVLGVGRVGVYGGYRSVKYIADHGLARWFWQTYAWSYGNWDPRTHIRQVKNGVSVCGGDVDLNEAHAEVIGAWNEEDDMDPNDVWHLARLNFDKGESTEASISPAEFLQRMETKQDAILKAAAGEDGDAIIAEIRAQGDATRAALADKLNEMAPQLAQAVADRVDHDLDVAAAAEAMRQVFGSLDGATPQA